MNTLPLRVDPLALTVTFAGDSLQVSLADGREISVPMAWFPRLLQATPEERSHWRLIGGGIGIHWESIDEDISVESLLTTE